MVVGSNPTKPNYSFILIYSMKILKQNSHISNNQIQQTYLLYTHNQESARFQPGSIITHNKKFVSILLPNNKDIILPNQKILSDNYLYLTLKNKNNDKTIFTPILSKSLYKIYINFLNKINCKKKNNSLKILQVYKKNQKFKLIFQALVARQGIITLQTKYKLFYNVIKGFKRWQKSLNLLKFKNLHY